MTTPKEYLEIALGGNTNISTLTLSAWEDLFDSYAKIRVKESGAHEMKETIKCILEEKRMGIVTGIDSLKLTKILNKYIP